MAELKESHIVEIPVDEEHNGKNLDTATMDMVISAIHQHPLMEISQSAGHLLLLKLWQREEDLFGRKIARKETRLESTRQEIFHLCCSFFLFHALFFTLLFTSSIHSKEVEGHVCKKWWILSLLSGSTSALLVLMAHVKLLRMWKVRKQLLRERSDGRSLTRCVMELRMKGSNFDLSKEPVIGGKRAMKSSSVEIKWKPVTWCSHYLITICLVCFAALSFPAPKLVLCGL
ncbi:hypothetical protein TIFTF001_028980 [Ficus carica]|uniref:Uncharacterized protein n=1 Tax=Ficus carica TaxID=3494 RepID=A0AA88IXC2_FICCA|nr:hypothetical protein TIFTF001_028980 [Ficus carica]